MPRGKRKTTTASAVILCNMCQLPHVKGDNCPRSSPVEVAASSAATGSGTDSGTGRGKSKASRSDSEPQQIVPR